MALANPERRIQSGIEYAGTDLLSPAPPIGNRFGYIGERAKGCRELRATDQARRRHPIFRFARAGRFSAMDSPPLDGCYRNQLNRDRSYAFADSGWFVRIFLPGPASPACPHPATTHRRY